jgi:PKD repeat protein
MKKLLLVIGLVFLFTQNYAQSVQRTMVVLEIGTGTWCQYCPGAALGADDLIANGCNVAVIENHNGDAFANQYSNARNTYYNITGFPTAFFDGTLSLVGGDHSVSMYPDYLPLYNQRYAVPSPVLIDISGSNSGDTYTVNISVKKVGTVTASDLRVHLALTESNIAYSWQGQSVLNYVNRLMAPDENGTVISFANGDFQVVQVTFTRNTTWVLNNLELIAFVQDNASKEILNGNKVMLTALPAPVAVDFSGTPTTGCAPLNVGFTDLSSGVTNWQWEFPGATPATSNQQNPSVVYNASGTYNVTLTAWNSATNRGSKKVRTGYITLNSAPVAPTTPLGNNSLCEDPANENYSTNTPPTTTSYTWDLQPPTAGTLTPLGNVCTVDWSSTYLGTAQLKVRAANACGDGPWSAPLTITISQTPDQPGDPTGPTQLCQDAANSEYVTPGSPSAGSYVWDLSPATAGTISGSWTLGTVDWSPTFSGTAEVKVKAYSGVCSSTWSNVVTVNVTAAPVPQNVTGGGAYCAIGGTGLPIGLDGSETGVDYTLYLDGTPTSNVVAGTGSAISFGNQMSAGTYTVFGANPSTSCSAGMTGSPVITVDPQAPETPGTPDGPDQVYSGSTPTTDYATTGGTYATTYTWTLTPTEAGTLAGTGSMATVTWDPSFIGTAVIKVQGVNSCGGGSFSNEFPISVDNGVGVAEVGKKGMITVFPNPAKSMINLRVSQKVTGDISLYNTLGTLVLEKQNQELVNNYKLDLNGLAPGLYFINFRGKDINQTVKIIIQ